MIEKISSQLVSLCIDECKKEKNKTVIKNSILDPLIMHILGQIQPFVIATVVYFITTLFLIILLIIIILWPKSSKVL
jgi:hypothetical protein